MKNNRLAIIQLGKWYIEMPDEPDYNNAYKWFNVAVAIGIKSANKLRNELIQELTPDEIMKSQVLSKNIFDRINKLGR